MMVPAHVRRPASSRPVSSRRPGDRVGRFELLDVLGDGRVGVSWRGIDLASGEEIVVRVLDVGGPEARAVLAAEIASSRPIPGVVPFMSVVTDGGAVAVIRAFVHATPLSVVLLDGDGMDLAEALPLFRELLSVVGALHRADRVHGAITAANVLLEVQGASIAPRLVDGGLVNTLRLPVNVSAERARYLAPEAEGPDDATPAADIFALGVLLYELVAGRSPFADRPEIVGGSLVYEPLSRIVPGCPAKVSAAVDRALSVSPRSRFLSCVLFASELPVVATRSSEEPTELDPALYWPDALATSHRSSERIERTALAHEDTAPIIRKAPERGRSTGEPSARPLVRGPSEPVVIQLASSSARAVPEDMVREMAEMRAPASRRARIAMVAVQLILGPLVLVGTLVVGQAWLAGRNLHEARVHAAEARASVDGELAVAVGEVERLRRLGAERGPMEEQLFATLDTRDLAARTEGATELRSSLLAISRRLVPPPGPRGAQEIRGVERRLELLGADAPAYLEAAEAEKRAAGASLADLGDRWGFADDLPWGRLDASLGRLLGRGEPHEDAPTMTDPP